MSNWQKTRFTLRALIQMNNEDNPICFDVVSFSSSFELNAIPTAQLSLAVGRRGDDVDKAAEIHDLVSQLKLQVPVLVLCKAENESGEHPRGLWPDGEFHIFEGYATGSGFRRSSTEAKFVLYCTHWLSELGFSSAISKQSHPLNPSELFYPATFGGADAGVNAAGAPTPAKPPKGIVSNILADDHFSQNNIFDDFWGKALLPWFVALSETDRINAKEIFDLSGDRIAIEDIEPGSNEDALIALRRFEPLTAGGYKLGVPVRPPVFDRDMGFCIASAIAEHVGMETQEAYMNTTLWDKLTGQLGVGFLYSVIPLVSKALVVPFIPGQSKLIHRFVTVQDYESGDLQAALPRPLRAVGVYANKGNETGFESTMGGGRPTLGIDGWFDKMSITPKDKNFARGLIMFKMAPSWLANLMCVHQFSEESTGMASTIKTAVSPDAGAASTKMAPAEIVRRSKPILDLYAQTLYNFEALKGRQGTVTGRVRFDIAPGSTVMVQAGQDMFIADCKAQEVFIGEVLRVSTTIDGQGLMAGTSFHIGYIRSATENKDPATSIERHPIFSGSKWAGCVLVEIPEFGVQATRELPPEEPENVEGED